MNTTTPAPEPVTGELVTTEARTLFKTDEPGEVLERARGVAGALKGALVDGGMVMRIGRNEHVLVDGWQTLGAMLGVSPNVVWSRPLEAGNGWEARAEARTLDGRVVGSAEAMVTRDERNWKRADEFALRSMAQTRAMSKALRAPLGFVVALGGLSTTPGEEVDDTTSAESSSAELPTWAQDIDEQAVDRMGDNLAGVVEAAGVTLNPEAVAAAVGNRLVKFCDGTLPACTAALAHELASAIKQIAGPPVPDTDAGDVPHASTPDN